MTLSTLSGRPGASLQPLMLMLALAVPPAKAQVLGPPAADRISLEPRPPVSRSLVEGTSPALIGALVGGGAGVVAGLLFVHEACNEDPCGTAAYVVGAVGGAALLGAMGTLIGSRTQVPPPARRTARIGAALGAGVGAVAGALLVAASCENESCGLAGYGSVAMAGAGVLGAVGAVVGSQLGGGTRAIQSGKASANPILGPSGEGILAGVGIRF